MEMNEIIEQAEENIRDAIADYRRHTNDTYVLDDISEAFIERLARDSSIAKQGLREMFSKSPAWDAELDALVINGTRTHDPDYSYIHALAFQIFDLNPGAADFDTLDSIVRFFTSPSLEEAQANGIRAMAAVAPKAYAPGKKLSRVFKAVCVALGVADETAGSGFQRLYAQFADELTAKRIGFKLFVSINPAHFLTMSNPKNDRRGTMLTSCHSFNSTEYEYNVGCTGYARDSQSFIVFTVEDPTDRETLNNRKTSRQIFAYKPGNGLLLQSRFYNTAGGTRGATEDSKLYRDLIQREISAIERVPNLWKTFRYHGGNYEHCVSKGTGFGGYADWEYADFDGKVSIRADREEDYKPLVVGTYGLCIMCAGEIDHKLYCEKCDGENSDDLYCESCNSYHNEDRMHRVHDSRGNEIWVCQDCLDEYYSCCESCNEYYPNERMTYVEGAGCDYCDDCIGSYCEQCEECGDWHLRENMDRAVNRRGEACWVCEDCRDRDYDHCEGCGSLVRTDDMETVFTASGYDLVCPDCSEGYEGCEDCGRLFENGALQDGLCPDCRQENGGEESA